ncbi:MAG: spore coat protein [Firmicutes bacterium]|nr:spore coat protein [Bacillota bacterium]
MNNDYLDPINAVGMPELADATFALDFLIRAKNGVRNCAYAIAETATPAARALLVRQLTEALAMHEQAARLMMDKGWLHGRHLHGQYQIDMISADTALQIAEMNLFPDHTSRLGMFATPDE